MPWTSTSSPPDAAARFDLDDGTVVAAHIADILNRVDASGRPPDQHGPVGPAWARGAAARGRLAVWIAVGMVTDQLQRPPADGLAMLRAAAYSAVARSTTSRPTRGPARAAH